MQFHDSFEVIVLKLIIENSFILNKYLCRLLYCHHSFLLLCLGVDYFHAIWNAAGIKDDWNAEGFHYHVVVIKLAQLLLEGDGLISTEFQSKFID